MADAVTFAGTQISISAGVPVTYDEAGFAALTYTSVGEVSSAPGDGGTTFEDVSYTVLGRRATVHLKGTSDQPEATMEVTVDRNDAGQIMLKAALLSPLGRPTCTSSCSGGTASWITRARMSA